MAHVTATTTDTNVHPGTAAFLSAFNIGSELTAIAAHYGPDAAEAIINAMPADLQNEARTAYKLSTDTVFSGAKITLTFSQKDDDAT